MKPVTAMRVLSLLLLFVGCVMLSCGDSLHIKPQTSHIEDVEEQLAPASVTHTTTMTKNPDGTVTETKTVTEKDPLAKRTFKGDTQGASADANGSDLKNVTVDPSAQPINNNKGTAPTKPQAAGATFYQHVSSKFTWFAVALVLLGIGLYAVSFLPAVQALDGASTVLKRGAICSWIAGGIFAIAESFPVLTEICIGAAVFVGLVFGAYVLWAHFNQAKAAALEAKAKEAAENALEKTKNAFTTVLSAVETRLPDNARKAVKAAVAQESATDPSVTQVIKDLKSDAGLNSERTPDPVAVLTTPAAPAAPAVPAAASGGPVTAASLAGT